MNRRKRQAIVTTVGLVTGLTAVVGVLPGASRIPTTLDDFFQPGSQPNGVGQVQYDFFRSSQNDCTACHTQDVTTHQELAILPPWQGSMMAQSARDPVFLAALAIANQDAAFAGDLCLRCHTPGGWISGRSEPTDGSALVAIDRDGVSCSVCHRMVDPEFKFGISPPADVDILLDLASLPASPGGGSFVLDPADVRRGPYPGSPDFDIPHLWLESPLHLTSEMCGTCHDVSNPVFLRKPDGTYALSLLDTPHPTGNKGDMFPLERTFSEWKNSEFASGGVDMLGRFGGTKQVVSTCQDCHMPTVTGKGASFNPFFDPPQRTDLKSHDFAGGNAWVQEMVFNLFPQDLFPNDGLNLEYLEAGMARSRSMLQRASSLEVTQMGNHINVRIINETGHKLPTGYPEGRRMWIHVTMFDAALGVLAEYGHYDAVNAELITENTKVFEVTLGADAAVAAAAGIEPGKGFHFALNNVVLKDNRIPPRGYTYSSFRDVQAEPIGTTYLDGQHWSDTRFRILDGAASATVEVMYQTSSKEFITFLRDENVTDSSGDILFEQWELTGKSPPVMMANAGISLESFTDGDFDGNGFTDEGDYAALFLSECEMGPGVTFDNLACGVFDYDEDGDIDLFDLGEFTLDFTASNP